MNADVPVVRSELRGAIALVTIDNPPVNALSHSVRSGLLDAVKSDKPSPFAGLKNLSLE